MFNQLIESLLIGMVNRVQDKRASSKRKDCVLVMPDGLVFLGHELSSTGYPLNASRPAFSLSEEARSKHLYAIGSSGCGKTSLLLKLIEDDLRNQRACIVFDMRGDMVDRVLGRMAHLAPPDHWRSRLLLLDLRQTRFTVEYNPLAEEPGDTDPYRRAFLVLSVLKHQADSWGIQLDETLRNCLIALAQSNGSLLEIETLLTNSAFRGYTLSTNQDAHVTQFFERYEKLSYDRQQTFALPVLNKVTPLLSSPQLRFLLGAQRSSFSFRQLLDRTPGAVILVSLAVDRLHESAHLVGGLLVSAIQNAIMARVDQPETARVPVRFYLDEFEMMATDRFAEIIAEGRRFKCSLALSHQNCQQLSTKLKHAIRTNVHSMFLFQTGSLDAAELASEVILPTPKENVRMGLMNQSVGECHVVRRGLTTVQIRLQHEKDPVISLQKIGALQQIAWQTYGRSQDEAKKSLEARQQFISALGQSGKAQPYPNASTTSQSAWSNLNPTYQVRNVNRKPKK